MANVKARQGREITHGGASFSGLRIRPPTPSVPYYHFAVNLNVRGSFTINEIIRGLDLAANGSTVVHFELRLDRTPPADGKPYGMDRLLEGPFYKDETVFRRGLLIGRLDWENNRKCVVEIALRIGQVLIFRRRLERTAPKAGGYWNRAWEHYQGVVVSESAGVARAGEPVQVKVAFFRDQIGDPRREVRVVEVDPRGGAPREIPSQVFGVREYNEKVVCDTKGVPFFHPTTAAEVLFAADTPANSSKVYLVFYGNRRARKPVYGSDLSARGPKIGKTIENKHYKVTLHPDSGMINEIRFKGHPDCRLYHGVETNGAIHWNPDIYTPPRPWTHISDWCPPPEHEKEQGPLMFMAQYRGALPEYPETYVAVTYRFYAGLPFVEVATTLEIRKTMPVQAVRNAEMVFAQDLFDAFAWRDAVTPRPRVQPLKGIGVWPMIRAESDAPWVCLLNREKGYGFAGIQLEYANLGTRGEPCVHNSYIYATHGDRQTIYTYDYFSRGLVNPYFSRNLPKMIIAPAGSVYHEKWAFLPFAMPRRGWKSFRAVEKWRKALVNPLHAKVCDPQDARSKHPAELFYDRKKGTVEFKGY